MYSRNMKMKNKKNTVSPYPRFWNGNGSVSRYLEAGPKVCPLEREKSAKENIGPEKLCQHLQ